MYPERNNYNLTMDNTREEDIHKAAIPAGNALSMFMRDLRISPSFTIVMDNPRARTSPPILFKKAQSEGKGRTRWHATADDTMNTITSTSGSTSKMGGTSSATPASTGKKLRRKLKSGPQQKAKNNEAEDDHEPGRAPSRSSSFDASSIVIASQRRNPLSRSYSDHLTAPDGNSQLLSLQRPPTLPKRRLSRDLDKAPQMAVRKASVSAAASTANARMPTRRNTSLSPTRNHSKSPTRNGNLNPMVV